jgi:hypothetical protein
LPQPTRSCGASRCRERVLIAAGIAADKRIVVQGAELIDQVR